MNNVKRLAYPYLLWMTLLVLIPIMFMVMLALGNTEGVDFSTYSFSFENFSKLGESIYIEAMTNSMRLSLITTLVALLIGYPVAYILANSKIRFKSLILITLILPTWSNMLLRIIAWEKLFYPNSLLNVVGVSLDLIGTDLAIIIGMVSIYLPFMIFPIYSVLDKMDPSLAEASADLGANKLQTFLRVTLPLSMSGIASGVIMTFLPSATAFAIPQRLGGGKILLIGNVIENMFKKAFNYNFGSMLSLVLMLIIFASMILMNKVDEDGETLI